MAKVDKKGGSLHLFPGDAQLLVTGIDQVFQLNIVALNLQDNVKTQAKQQVIEREATH